TIPRAPLATTALTALFILSLGASAAPAAGDPEPRAPSGTSAPSGQPSGQKGTEQMKQKKKQKKSEQDFRDGYRAAHALVQAGRYEAAFAAFKALDEDDHPDVANYLGFTSRKLGRYDDAKHWYERALAADPKHVRTWQYY